MRKRFRVLIIIVFGFIILVNISGCASIAKGTSQYITVNTNPSGATCKLLREEKTIAIVHPTPGKVVIDKDKDTINVVCKKDEYQDSAVVIPAKFQGMTFGNILIGGLIGLAVDAGSGAMHHYQPMLTITMIPESFNSISERDDFFDKLKSDYLAEYSENIKRINNRCDMIQDEKEYDKNNCRKQLKVAEANKDKHLSEIDRKRELTKVNN